MPFVETDASLVLRDTESRTLTCTDKVALLKSRTSRNKTIKIQQQQEELDQQFQTMGERLDRCEKLLHELTQHICSLVAKLPAE